MKGQTIFSVKDAPAAHKTAAAGAVSAAPGTAAVSAVQANAAVSAAQGTAAAQETGAFSATLASNAASVTLAIAAASAAQASGAQKSAAPLVDRAQREHGSLTPSPKPHLRRPPPTVETASEDFGEILRHELNNPLTGILGNAELLLAEIRRDDDHRLPRGGEQRLETIAALAVRLRETIRRISQEWLVEGSVVRKKSDSEQ